MGENQPAVETIVYRIRAIDKAAYMLAGFGLYAAIVLCGGPPLGAMDAISPAAAADLAEQEQLARIDASKKWIKKPDLKEKKEKVLSATLKLGK